MSEPAKPVDPLLQRYVDQAERYERCDFDDALRELWVECNAGKHPLPAALLAARSERAPSWLETFGRLWAPIRSDVPHPATRPDGTRALFYHCDIDRLTREQIRRVIIDRARRCKLPAWEVEATILGDPEHGLPILADEVLPVRELPGLLDYMASC